MFNLALLYWSGLAGENSAFKSANGSNTLKVLKGDKTIPVGRVGVVTGPVMLNKHNSTLRIDWKQIVDTISQSVYLREGIVLFHQLGSERLRGQLPLDLDFAWMAGVQIPRVSS